MSKNFIADKATLDAVKTAVDSLAAIWTNVVANKIESIVQTVSTINSTVATNNTSNSTGTLSQKLSYIISQISGQGQGISTAGRRRSTKFASVTYAASTTTTLLNVTGPGEVIFIYIGGQTSTGLTLSLVIDGVTHTVAAQGGRSYGIGTGYVDGNLLSHVTDSQRYVVPISYAKSCKVTIANSGTTTAPCKVLYNSFEAM